MLNAYDAHPAGAPEGVSWSARVRLTPHSDDAATVYLRDHTLHVSAPVSFKPSGDPAPSAYDFARLRDDDYSQTGPIGEPMYRLSTEQQTLLAKIEQVAANTVGPNADATDSTGAFPRASIDALGRSGALGLNVPAEYG